MMAKGAIKQKSSAQALAVVWGIFTFIWSDIDTWMGIMGGKLQWSLKPDIARSAETQRDKKRVKTNIELAEARGVKTGNRRLIGHIIQDRPVPDRVPEPLMYGRGNPSSIDYGANPVQ